MSNKYVDEIKNDSAMEISKKCNEVEVAVEESTSKGRLHEKNCTKIDANVLLKDDGREKRKWREKQKEKEKEKTKEKEVEKNKDEKTRKEIEINTKTEGCNIKNAIIEDGKDKDRERRDKTRDRDIDKEKERNKDRERDKERNRNKDKGKNRDKAKDKEKDKEKGKEKEREKDEDKGRDRRLEREKNQNQSKEEKRKRCLTNSSSSEELHSYRRKKKGHRSRGSSISRSKGRNRDRNRGRSKNRSRDKGSDRSRDVGSDISRGRSGYRSSYRSRSSNRRRDRSSDRSRDRSSDRSTEKSRDRSIDRSRDRSIGRSRNRGIYRSRNRNLYFSSTSSEERYYYRKKKKHRKISSNENHSDKGKDANKSGTDTNTIEEVKQKRKSKWDTVDQNSIKNCVLENSLKSLLQKQTLNLASNLLQNSKLLQLNRSTLDLESDKKQRKLYIGNIPTTSNQEGLVEFFNNTILSLIKDTSFEVKIGDIILMPVVKCEIFNAESKFCFLEFRTIKITCVSLKLDGVSYMNHSLRIGRPHDYVPPPGGDPLYKESFEEIDLKKLELLKPAKPVNVRSVDDEKLYIQNLPHDLKDEQIRDLLEQFGKLKIFNIIKDPNTGLNKGYGFFEYEDSSITQIAMHALNGFVCGNSVLNVKKANSRNQNAINNPNNVNNILLNNPELKVGYLPCSISQQILKNTILGLQIQAAKKQGEKPSRVVQLTNAVFQEDLLIDSQYKEILKDIKSEAEKYGPLKSIVIPRPSKDLSASEGVGKVFLYYQDETTARKAQFMFNGRIFEKRVVCAAFYSEEKFLQGKYVLS